MSELIHIAAAKAEELVWVFEAVFGSQYLFDGMPPIILGGVIRGLNLSFFREFRNSGIINNISKETYISKKISSRHVRDYQPISLGLSLYKIISKDLEDAILIVQGAFVKKREIMNLILFLSFLFIVSSSSADGRRELLT